MDGSLVRADASLNSVLKLALDKLDEPAGKETKKSVNQTHQIKTDPEASLVRHGKGKSLPSYKVHRAIDDEHGVITAVLSTTGACAEAHCMEDLVTQHQTNTSFKPKAVIADSGYGTSENFIALAQKGIRSHMADLRAKHNNLRQEGIYPAEDFMYD